MGCGSIIAHISCILLTLVNSVVFLCGAAIVAIAIALKIVTDDVLEWLFNILGNILQWGLMAGAFYVMIGVGVFLMLVGFFGCCGAMKRSSCMLTTYIIIIVVILVLQIAGAVLAAVFLGYLDETVENVMKENVQTEYGNTDITTSSWDNMQFELKCCGGVSYTDYNESYYFTDTGNIVPKSCCSQATKDGSTIILDDGEWYACKTAAASYIETGGLFYSQGCYDTGKSWLTSHTDVLIGVMVGLAVFQIVSIIMACCVMKQDDYFA